MSYRRRAAASVGAFVAPLALIAAVTAGPVSAEPAAAAEGLASASTVPASPTAAPAMTTSAASADPAHTETEGDVEQTQLLAAPMSGTSATPVSGRAFDLCAAPSLSDLAAWLGTSPYNTVNIYFGGSNRACEQPNLTADWVHDATAMGWKILPTYVGHQPSCVYGNPSDRFSAGNATELGTADATDAVERARELGLQPGSALYADIEHYDRSDRPCRVAVLRYMVAWTAYVHEAGYLSGYYSHQASGIREVADAYERLSTRRPDAIWTAQWDENPALSRLRNVSDWQWANWQRIKQYIGDHDETWGGVTQNIDTNSMRAPMATVARSFMVPLSAVADTRAGPSRAFELVRSYAPGEELRVVCQTLGEQSATTRVWNRLSDGSWISDFFTSTPSMSTFSGGLPRCTYAGQVTRSSLNTHTGPGADYPVTGSPLPLGALAYVVCQKTGSLIGSTEVWNMLSDGRWVTDFYVDTESDTDFSPLIPRCP